VLSLVGADVRSWFYHMKKPTRLLPQKRPTTALALPSPQQQPAQLFVPPDGLARMVGGPAFTAAAAAAAAAAAQQQAAAAAGGGAAASGGGFGLTAALAGYQQQGAHAGSGVWGLLGGGGAAALLPGYLAGPAGGAAAAGSATIDTYYLSRHCAVCDELTRAGQPLCDRCRANPQVAAVVLAARAARLERQHQQLVRLCQSCGGGGGSNMRHGGVVCTSLDCGLYYERFKVVGEMRAMGALAAAGLDML
jgi:hypothetical protein